MAFVTIPIFFAEADAEQKEEMGLPVKQILGEITINTSFLLAFNGTETNTVYIRMSSGEGYECAMSRDEFESIIEKVDGIYRLSCMGTN